MSFADTAPRLDQPTPSAIDAWTRRLGDERAALLCATAELAIDTLASVSDEVRAGSRSVQALRAAKTVADEARGKVRDYYGESFADQPAAVLRIAR